jgi:hypothetical protein
VFVFGGARETTLRAPRGGYPPCRIDFHPRNLRRSSGGGARSVGTERCAADPAQNSSKSSNA